MAAVSILTLEFTQVAVRMANESLPVNVIARCLDRPSEVVRHALQAAFDVGQICEIPRPDWPPTSRLSDHLPIRAAVPSDDTILFALRKLMRLSPLEGALLSMLIKFDEADKEKLHRVIENLREKRAGGPIEPTDPKMVDVMICKLRKRLKSFDNRVEIKTMWGRGYYIEQAARNVLLDHISKILSAEGEAKRART